MTFLAALRDTSRPDDDLAVRIDQESISWSVLRSAASAFARTLDGAGPAADGDDPQRRRRRAHAGHSFAPR